MTTKTEAKQEDSRSATSCRTDVVLSKGVLGEISSCSGGCVHIDSPAISFRMTEPDFRALVQMVSEAATKLTVLRSTAVH